MHYISSITEDLQIADLDIFGARKGDPVSEKFQQGVSYSGQRSTWPYASNILFGEYLENLFSTKIASLNEASYVIGYSPNNIKDLLKLFYRQKW